MKKSDRGPDLASVVARKYTFGAERAANLREVLIAVSDNADDSAPQAAGGSPMDRWRAPGPSGAEWQAGDAGPEPQQLSKPVSTSKPGWLVVGAVALIAALAGGVTGGFVVATFNHDGGSAPASTPPKVLTVEQTSAISSAAAAARPSVVRIESTKRTANGVEQDVGSGVVLDTDGHILTNAHVVIGTDSLKVILADGTERGAILLGHDAPYTDVAVLQIGPGNLTPIPVGDSGALKLGETVVAIGNPLAEFDGSVSVGVVSGLTRVRTFDGVRQDDLIQTDAAVNHGNSGGALVNLDGQFVGMPTAVLRATRTGDDVEGIAFALPANRLLEVASVIIRDGSYPRPSLQIAHQDLTADLLARLGRVSARNGALVVALAPNGVAEAAGIEAGDVVTSIGGQTVDADHPLSNVLMGFAPGATVKVVLNRNGRIIETEVRLALRS